MEQYREIESKEIYYATADNGNEEINRRLAPKKPLTFIESNCFLRIKQAMRSFDEDDFFIKITKKDRRKVREWLKNQTGKTIREKFFLRKVKEAVWHINYDYWIASIEPSVEDGEIYYAVGEKVGTEFTAEQWKFMAKSYAPDRGSRLAKLLELIMWYALRIANGLWTLDYVANDSSSAGNYKNAPDALHEIEKTGERVCGGYKDGQGNTYKIVTSESGYALVGGFHSISGHSYPVGDVEYNNEDQDVQCSSTGVLVFTKLY